MQFSYKGADVPVISTTRARGGPWPDSAVLLGGSTGAVLGQGVHARCCCGADGQTVQKTVVMPHLQLFVVKVLKTVEAPQCSSSTWVVLFMDKVVDCPSLCTSRVWCAGDNPWKFHRCSSGTRRSRLLLLCVADGQTEQETVEMPQFQFLNMLMDVLVISQRQVPEKGTFLRPRRLTAVSCRGLGVALTPGISPNVWFFHVWTDTCVNVASKTTTTIVQTGEAPF